MEVALVIAVVGGVFALLGYLFYCINRDMTWIIKYYYRDETGRFLMSADECRKRDGNPPLTEDEKWDYIKFKLGDRSSDNRYVTYYEFPTPEHIQPISIDDDIRTLKRNSVMGIHKLQVGEIEKIDLGLTCRDCGKEAVTTLQDGIAKMVVCDHLAEAILWKVNQMRNKHKDVTDQIEWADKLPSFCGVGVVSEPCQPTVSYG